MTERLEIRPARSGDSEFVAGLASSLLEFGSPIWTDAEALAPGFRRVLIEAVRDQDDRSAVLIAEDANGTPLGFISLKVGADATGIERAHVADLAVTERARRSGVGRALMEAGEAWARARGYAVLSLDVWATNDRAIAFYRRLGYVAESLCLVKTFD
jgi:ribosomal protein S18 acetylase RimI-like enzyme